MSKRKRTEDLEVKNMRVQVTGIESYRLADKVKKKIKNAGGVIVAESSTADFVVADSISQESRDKIEEREIEIYSTLEILSFFKSEEIENREDELGVQAKYNRTNSVTLRKKYKLDPMQQSTPPTWFSQYMQTQDARFEELGNNFEKMEETVRQQLMRSK
eukprot:TRINITY_DN3665_c0_g1_i1.p1 TRINITY_DN3665_c0_g1~~TRINITY_DN3665_c0_g1_i1.p1  ORF type:complete len:160 (-),score=23.96 TRINITY_DN3665_c0_g1_i1:184-663(-)